MDWIIPKTEFAFPDKEFVYQLTFPYEKTKWRVVFSRSTLGNIPTFLGDYYSEDEAKAACQAHHKQYADKPLPVLEATIVPNLDRSRNISYFAQALGDASWTDARRSTIEVEDPTGNKTTNFGLNAEGSQVRFIHILDAMEGKWIFRNAKLYGHAGRLKAESTKEVELVVPSIEVDARILDTGTDIVAYAGPKDFFADPPFAPSDVSIQYVNPTGETTTYTALEMMGYEARFPPIEKPTAGKWIFRNIVFKHNGKVVAKSTGDIEYNVSGDDYRKSAMIKLK